MRIAPLFLALAVLGSGCAGVGTDYDYDPLYSFADLKSYAWKRSTAEQVMDPFVVRYVQAAVHRELAARGFVRSEKPDFLVILRDESEDRLEVDERSGAFRQTLNARNLHRDDLILQIVEPKTERIIWRGVAGNVIDRRSSSEERRARIDSSVRAVLKHFPPRT